MASRKKTTKATKRTRRGRLLLSPWRFIHSNVLTTFDAPTLQGVLDQANAALAEVAAAANEAGQTQRRGRCGEGQDLYIIGPPFKDGRRWHLLAMRHSWARVKREASK